MRQTRRKGTQGVLHPRCCESPCDGQQCLIFDEENWWEVLDDLPCFTTSFARKPTALAVGGMANIDIID